ncbi:CocE/NonD family hydrolase [Planosporangium sp. 12N6]|uniref:CocE/NonD family hydrolase n=1 Tax=Planosporangium spinosum TaxID=3402278 RepID=UPI003CEF859E
MSDEKAIFVKNNPYDESKEKGRFSRFDPGTRTLPKGWRYGKPYAPLTTDIVFEKDIAVELRDGVTIYVDVFRPAGATDIPVIIAWSPYGKSRGAIPSVTAVRKRLGIDQSKLSGLMKFEAPDPGYWCAQGYAVCNPDARGAFNSEGDTYVFGRKEGQDAYDLVEWLAEQDWCSGKVAMSGNSYLAVSQWFTAAEQPPHLAAIAPWEGFSDLYRDIVLRGGIPDFGVVEQLRALNNIGNNNVEDVVAAAAKYPLMNDYWETKIPRLDTITIPAYVVASYTNTFHTQGTFRAWRLLASEHKWLRIHNGMEWPDYYSEDSMRDLTTFFDHYLKGADNDWPHTPRVRYSLLDLHGHDVVNRPSEQFPPKGTNNVRYYLDSTSASMSTSSVPDESQSSYPGDDKSGRAEFTVAFDRETELAGYPKVKLWVEADGADDMDLFLVLQKLDAHGKPIEVLNVDTKSLVIRLMTRHSASILKYRGANGRLRVSLRHLDEQASTEELPVHTFDRSEPLQPGQIVPIEIPLYPIGLIMHPGEQLRLVIAGHNLIGTGMPRMSDAHANNHGRHIIHTGGRHDSHLLLPILT